MDMKRNVLKISSAALGLITLSCVCIYQGVKNYLRLVEKLDKDIYIRDIKQQTLKQWIHAAGKGKFIDDYLLSQGIDTISIYGWNDMGRLLCEHLMNRGKVKIKYIVDRNAGKRYNLPDNYPRLYSPKSDLEEVKMLIVTPVMNLDEIREAMKMLCDCEIIPLYKLIFYI